MSTILNKPLAGCPSRSHTNTAPHKPACFLRYDALHNCWANPVISGRRRVGTGREKVPETRVLRRTTVNFYRLRLYSRNGGLLRHGNQAD